MSDFESGAFNRALPTLRFVTLCLSASYDHPTLDRFRCRTSGVRFGVPSISQFHQPVDGRRLVLGSKMGIPHDHLERPVPEQFCHRAQIYPGHYESTCKGMAVAMPGVPFDLCLFERAGEPAS